MNGKRLAVLLFAAAGLLAIGAVAPVALHPSGAGSPGSAGGAAPRTAIEALQARLHEVPKDWKTWASLGSAYVEQARITGDPSFYPKAQGALERSRQLSEKDNWAALVGLGSLANARHDFHAALDWGRRAERINPAAGSVHGVIADALTQLGDADGARAATQRMLDVQPGVASFTRASYDFELHGQVDRARDALQRALAEAGVPADRAFCHNYLGELALGNGDPRTALAEFDAGIAADAGYQLLHAGRAKALLALGRGDEALREYDLVVQRLPLPGLIAEYGDALVAAGQSEKAKRQYDLHAVQQRLFSASGVRDGLADAVYLADHGQPAEALAAARAEWADRQPVLVADALGWALHRTGQDAEALTYARQATALGWRNATFLYHRGVIQHALGDDVQARRDLTDALTLNPSFDALQAPQARQLLSSLGVRS